MINAKTILLYGFFLSLIGALFKAFFFTTLNDQSLFLQIIFQILLALLAIGCVRRLGIIHYLEALFVMGLWLVFALGFDAFIFLLINNFEVYLKFNLWLSYIVMLVAIFLFHKKRHVDIRIKNKKEE